MKLLFEIFSAFPVLMLFIFGDDPDRLGFYVAVLFILIYIVVMSVLIALAIAGMIMSGIHMFFTILTWFG